MICTVCGNEFEDKSECPRCKNANDGNARTSIEVKQEIRNGHDIKGLELGQLNANDVSIRNIIKLIEPKIIHKDYIDRQYISYEIQNLGPEFIDALAQRLIELLKVDINVLQNPGAQPIKEDVGQKITEIIAAQKDAASKGIAATPQAAYNLGILSAYNRDYETSLDFFRQAINLNNEYLDAYKAIAWLQQYRALHDIEMEDYDSANAKLSECLEAVRNTDPLDLDALALRGYIYLTFAKMGKIRNDDVSHDKNIKEAERLFQRIAELDPTNASALNGLADIYRAQGKINDAIIAYNKAIYLAPYYTAAYHDLAQLYEKMMDKEHDKGKRIEWGNKSLEAWHKAYESAPDDSAFSEKDILFIGQKISKLRRQLEELNLE